MESAGAAKLPTASDRPTQLPVLRARPPSAPGGRPPSSGEAGCIGVPPAVVGAVCDALDVGHIDMPLTPETVWRAAHPAA